MIKVVEGHVAAPAEGREEPAEQDEGQVAGPEDKDAEEEGEDKE